MPFFGPTIIRWWCRWIQNRRCVSEGLQYERWMAVVCGLSAAACRRWIYSIQNKYVYRDGERITSSIHPSRKDCYENVVIINRSERSKVQLGFDFFFVLLFHSFSLFILLFLCIWNKLLLQQWRRQRWRWHRVSCCFATSIVAYHSLRAHTYEEKNLNYGTHNECVYYYYQITIIMSRTKGRRIRTKSGVRRNRSPPPSCRTGERRNATNKQKTHA